MMILMKYGLNMKYEKRLTIIFNEDIFRKNFSPEILREEIIHTYQAKIFALNKEGRTCKARKKIL